MLKKRFTILHLFKWLIPLTCCIWVSQKSGFAQDLSESDLGYWHLFSVEKDLDSTTGLQLSNWTRLNNRLKNPANLLVQLDLKRKLGDKVKLVLGVRYGAGSRVNGVKNRYYRGEVSMYYNTKLSEKLKSTYRFRVQSRYKLYQSDGFYGSFTTWFRNYYRLGFKVSDVVRPYGAIESSHSLNSGALFLTLQRIRIRPGMYFYISEKVRANLFYNMQWTGDQGERLREQMLGTALSFKF